MPRLTLCPCGSGEYPELVADARNIFIGYMCSKCKAGKLARFRPEVLTDPNYAADEPIDDE